MSQTKAGKYFSWRDALAVYMRPRVIAMMFLGFSAGLPFLLEFHTLSAWLRTADVSLAIIGLLSLVGITHSIKFLWAPLINHLPVPFLTRLLGHRRSWMLVGQFGVIVGLCGIALTGPEMGLFGLVAFAVVLAFSAATQDISIDAYRVEAVGVEAQGAMAATYIFGYRVAILVAGFGALQLAAHISWPVTYLIMAACMLSGIATTLIISEPIKRTRLFTYLYEAPVRAYLKSSRDKSILVRKSVAWFIGAVWCPLVEFFESNRRLAIPILVFVAVYRLSDLTMGSLSNAFYLDIGFSLEQISFYGKFFGFFMTIFGAVTGGVLVVRFGLLGPLLFGAILVAITNLLFAVLAGIGPDPLWLAIVISADNISGGIATAVFLAYLTSLTSKKYTATQYALFSSLMTLPGKIMGGFSGFIAESVKYELFFLYSACLGIPAILLVLYLMRKHRKSEASLGQVE